LGVSMPVFYSSLLMILLFSFTLGWLPATGQGGVARLVMPATALGLISAAVLARLVRSGMLAVLRQEYVVTARAKGLAPRVVVLRHALKNALIPTITMLGLQLGALLGGAVVTETIFSRPGVGRLAVDAILSRDFPLVQGTVLFTAVAYVLVNLLVDISYAAIDPRVRYQKKCVSPPRSASGDGAGRPGAAGPRPARSCGVWDAAAARWSAAPCCWRSRSR